MRIRWAASGILSMLASAIVLAVPGAGHAAGPVLTVLPSTTIDVGEVRPGGTSAVATYSIVNTGDATLHFLGESSGGISSGLTTSIDPPCFFTPPPLAPGESCTLHSQLFNAPTQLGPFVGGFETFFTDGGDVTITFVGTVVSARPNGRDECMHGGWRDFGVFKNQGACIAFVATHGRNEGNPGS